jgi:HAD superfamily hydrolase (TIGR01509 family)
MMKSKFKAALFDLDGTLLDTEAQYTEFWSEMGRQYRPDLPDFNSLIKGTTLTQIYDLYIAKEYRATITAQLDEWEAQMDYHLMPGAEDYLKRLRNEGVKTALVTSSNDKKMRCVRHAMPQFYDLFDVVLTSEDFTRSKPFPDCYLKAAEVLDVQPDDCIVFEDAFSGLQAGRDAGMYVIGLATTNSREAIEDKCDRVINSFLEL